MYLVDFKASEGDLRFLWEACTNAKVALVHGHTLDVQITGAIIDVAAGYVFMSQASSTLSLAEDAISRVDMYACARPCRSPVGRKIPACLLAQVLAWKSNEVLSSTHVAVRALSRRFFCESRQGNVAWTQNSLD